MATRGIGASLASIGASRGQEALQMASRAAETEERRDLANKQMEQQQKAGNQQLGATMGATVGMQVYGPVGALVGGAIGAIAGGMID